MSCASVDPSALPPSRGDQHLFFYVGSLLSILDVLMSDLLLRAPNTLASCAPPSHPARGVAVWSENEEIFWGVSFENCYRVILFLEMGQLSGLESEKLFEIVGLMPGLDINSI